MSKILAALAVIALTASCDHYDDTSVMNEIDSLKGRVTALERAPTA